MDNINERIKQVRIESGMSTRAFASAIGIGGSAVCLLEGGRNHPREQTIRAICKEFKICREWLETGKGPMHETVDKDDFTAINEVLQLGNENKIRLFRIIADMPEPLLDEMMEYLKSKMKDLP